MTLNQWALKWGVSFEAVEDLRRQFGAISTEPQNIITGQSEAAVQNRIRLEASRLGARLWRNNVGAVTDAESDRLVRYGLCNDSAQINRKIKSSDLIGVRPVLIGPQHLDTVIGQFVAREIKPEGWHYTATEREQAQLRFLELVIAMGGDAAFATGEGTL